MSVLTTVAWRSHRRHPMLALLAIIGIALGVAVSTAIALANAAARQAFTESLDGLIGHATHQVVAGSYGLPESAYPGIRRAAMAAGAAVAPVVEAEVAVVDRPGRSLRLLGVDPFAEAPFRDASPKVLQDQTFPLRRLLTEPNTVVLTRATANDLGLGIGETFRIRHGSLTQSVTLVAILAEDGNAVARQLGFALCDLATAQELLGRNGRIDYLDVRVAEADTTTALAAISAALPAAAEIVPASRRSDSLRQLTEAFHTNLHALGLIALVVGMFLIANTASFAVVRRRELFARLRAHGATPRQILGMVMGEALAAGIMASLLGVVLGTLLAQVLIRLVARTIGDLYANIGQPVIAVEPAIIIQGLLLGMGATLLAAWLPALDAARSAPRLGAVVSQHEHAWRRSLPWLALAGGGLFGLCALILLAFPPTINAGFVGLGCGLIAAAVLVPVLLVPLVRLLAWPWRNFPIVTLASRAVGANLSRTGIAVAALSVACAAALGMTLMVGSFRLALSTWLATTLTSDVYVSAPRLIAARVGETPLAPTVVERLLAVPGIASVVTKRDAIISVEFPDGDSDAVTLATFTPLEESRTTFVSRPAFASPAARDAAWAAFAAGAVFVTEPFATHRQVFVGQELTLLTPAGRQRLKIAAVVVDYSSDAGAVYLHRQYYQKWFADDSVTALAVNAAPGVSADELAGRLRRAAGEVPLSITSSRALTQASLTVFDRTFAITSVIRWLAAGVAVLGLIAALAAVQIERARTTARLRAGGVTPNEVIGLALGECLFTGAAAGLLAMPMGIALAAGLTHVINRRSFGWSMDLAIDGWQLLLTVALAMFAAVVAGFFPAWRASRRPLAEALHAD